MPLPKVFALVMIVSTMFSAGLRVDRASLGATLRDTSLLGRALLVNFVLVPLFAVLLVRTFSVPQGVAIGILLMAMAPGVPFLVNTAGIKQGGSHAFALEIAFLFSALSVLTIPITASLVFPPNVLATVPAAQFLTTLVLFQILPLVLGVLAAPKLGPAKADQVANVLHLVFLVSIAGLAVLLVPKLVEAIRSVFGAGNLLIIAAIGLFAWAAGWLLGGPDRQYRRTLSIAALMRNIGICVLVGADFPGTLVLPTVLTYFFVGFILSIPARVFYARTAAAAPAQA